MAKRSKIKVFFEILIAILLAIPFWFLGLLTFASYVIAFLGALRNKLFKRRKNIPKRLFFGTVLIYFAGLLAPIIFTRLNSGDLVSGSLMLLLAAYLWIKGSKARKHGKRFTLF